MKFKALILILIIAVASIMLIGFDTSKFRSTLITLGIGLPEYSDIQYEDKNLKRLFEELYLLDPNDELLVEEYEWIANKSKGCWDEECLIDEELQHQLKLQSALAKKLLAVPFEKAKVRKIILPEGLNSLNVNQSGNYEPRMAYTPKANILAYKGNDGRIHIVDLNEGKYLKTFNKNYNFARRNRNLQLSDNGKLLLVQYNELTELVSTATGNILASKEYFHDVRFTKDSSNVVLHGKESVVLLNSFDLELTNFSLEFSIKNHRNLRQIAFNSDTNTLAVWGEKKVTLVSI